MVISTRGRYALRLLLDLAEHADEGFVSLKDIAERQDISLKYVEQLMPQLIAAGMLDTARGKSGGYKLARKPDEYPLGEILRITEGSLAPVKCLSTDENLCPRKEKCETLPVWTELDRIISDYLDGVTLKDVIEQKNQ